VVRDEAIWGTSLDSTEAAVHDRRVVQRDNPNLEGRNRDPIRQENAAQKFTDSVDTYFLQNPLIRPSPTKVGVGDVASG
jgi:hypothetical protein